MKILRKKKESPEESGEVADKVGSNKYEVRSTTSGKPDEGQSTEYEVTDKVGSNKYEVRSTTSGKPDEGQSTKYEATDKVGSNKYEVESTEEEDGSEDGITESFVREARAFADGKGLSPEEFNEALTQLKQFRSPSTPVTVKMLEMILKAINYDHDVAQAMEQGEIKGRNAKIEQCLMQPEQSDGLPHIKGSDVSKQKHTTSIFDLARSVR